MVLAYHDYLFNNLIFPILALAFVAVPVFKMFARIARQLVNHESPFLGDSASVVLFIALLLVGAIMIATLFNGGIHLIYERPDDAVTVEGTIEDIQSCSILTSPKYFTTAENANGYKLTVGDTTCVIHSIGTLEVGQQVTVTYLPKSGFVLEITEVGLSEIQPR